MLDEAFGMAGIRSRKNIETHREYEQGLPQIKGNPVLIREVLSNLFSNAMDAVEEEGVIRIGASRANGTVAVKISDNGVGIPEDRKRHLFEPFATTKPNGQGLGLFAAKHIMEMHYGTVEVESSERKGTSVIVRLPVAPSQDETDPAERSDNLLSTQSR